MQCRNCPREREYCFNIAKVLWQFTVENCCFYAFEMDDGVVFSCKNICIQITAFKTRLMTIIKYFPRVGVKCKLIGDIILHFSLGAMCVRHNDHRPFCNKASLSFPILQWQQYFSQHLHHEILRYIEQLFVPKTWRQTK